MSNFLQPHGLQHTRLPCLSPSPKVCPSLFTESVMPTPISPSLTLFFCLQSFPASGSFPVRQLFCIRWPKDWSFSFSISPSNEYSGLISFKIDWFDLLAVQEILNCLLQHHSSKTSILHHSVFFIVQLSHPYMATGKTIAFTIWTFVGKVLCLCFLIHHLGLS